jgi:hypothetical protein
MLQHALDAAGVTEVGERSVAPSVVRPLLRTFFSSKKHLLTSSSQIQMQQAHGSSLTSVPGGERGHGSMQQQQLPLTCVEAVELLKYCCSDVRLLNTEPLAVPTQQVWYPSYVLVR